MRRILIVALAGLAIAACGSSSTTTLDNSPATGGTSASGATSGASGLVLARRLVGTYKGTWMDTKYKGSGDVTFVFALDETAKTLTITLTLGGAALPAGAAGTETYPAVPVDFTDPSKIAFKAASSKFGPISVTFDSSGNFVASVPNFSPGSTTFTGTVDGSTIKGNAVVTQSGGNAGGPLTLTKQ